MTETIQMGNYINKYGVTTEKRLLFPIEKIQSHVLISGTRSAGGSQLLARIGNQLHDNFPDIGVININQFSLFRKNRYLYNTIFNNKSRDFRIPYYVEGKDREESIRQTITYLSAALGFSDKLRSIWQDAMEEIEIPKLLSTLLYKLYDYIKDNNIDIGGEILIFPAIANNTKDSNLDRILELTPELPDWIIAWRNGTKIFLDIEGLCGDDQRILTNALYQLIKTVLPEGKYNRPQGIILVEEANYALLNRRPALFSAVNHELEQGI